MLAIRHSIRLAILLAAAGVLAATTVDSRAAATAREGASKTPLRNPKTGKPYAEITKPDPADWKKVLMAISQAGGKATDEERETFSAHYWAVLGEFTQQAHCASLHEKRAALKKQLNILGRYEDKSLHDALVTFFATNFPKVFESDAFSPAARVNCLLVYSDLNSNEGEDIVATGAVPLAKALPTLIDVLKNKDGKFPAYLQPVALVGVTRHVFSSKGSLTSEQRKDLVQTLSGWLRDPQLKGVTPEVQNFVRRRAGEVLRVLAPKWPEANSADVAGR